MSGETDCLDAESALEGYLSQIDSFLVESKFDNAKFKEEFLEYSNLSKQELNAMTQQSLFNGSYLLFDYCGYIQDCINREKVILSWCNSQLDKLVMKYEQTSGFDKYTKHEAKRPMVIHDNIYAAKVEELRLMAEAKVQMLDSKSYNVRRLGETLLEKAKRS